MMQLMSLLRQSILLLLAYSCIMFLVLIVRQFLRPFLPSTIAVQESRNDVKKNASISVMNDSDSTLLININDAAFVQNNYSYDNKSNDIQTFQGALAAHDLKVKNGNKTTFGSLLMQDRITLLPTNERTNETVNSVTQLTLSFFNSSPSSGSEYTNDTLLSMDESTATSSTTTLPPTTRASKMLRITSVNEINSSFVVNAIMTTRDPVPSSCHRTCVDFRNKIYFAPLNVGEGDDDDENGVFQGAGLIDRLTIISTLLNMAGYLCARVYVPRPRLLLGAHHNAGRKLDANISWSDFGDYTFWHDPLRQPALVNWEVPKNMTDWLHESSRNASLHVVSYLQRQVKFNFPIFEEFALIQQQTISGKAGITTNATKGYEGGFVWILQAEYYDWCNLLSMYFWKRPPPEYFSKEEADMIQQPYIFSRPTLYTGCQYAKVTLPIHLQNLRDVIVKAIWQPAVKLPSRSLSMVSSETATFDLSSLLGYLHIRRKDAVRECNTSLKRMEAFLKCSLDPAIAHLSRRRFQRPVVVLFSSDEDDPKYRADVKNAIEQQQQQQLQSASKKSAIQVTALDLDNLVESVLRKEIAKGNAPASRLNSFYIFQLIFSIGYNQSIVHFHMEQRRDGNCKACNNVTEQLVDAGVVGN